MEWKKGLEEGRYASRAAIAKRQGISRARVTQILNFLKLPIIEAKADVLTERKLREILKGNREK